MKFVYFGESIQPADQETAEHVAQMQEGDELELIAVKPKQRTSKQNRSMWKYCELLALKLNAAGFDMRTFPFKSGLEIPWTKNSVMNIFWRPIQEAMYDQQSTTELTTAQTQEVYMVMDKTICDRTEGVRVEWPCRDSQMNQAMERKVA